MLFTEIALMMDEGFSSQKWDVSSFILYLNTALITRGVVIGLVEHVFLRQPMLDSPFPPLYNPFYAPVAQGIEQRSLIEEPFVGRWKSCLKWFPSCLTRQSNSESGAGCIGERRLVYTTITPSKP